MSDKPSIIAELLHGAIDIQTDDSDPIAQQIADRLDRAARRYRRLPDDRVPPDGLVVVGIGWEPMLRPLANPTANVGWTELRGHDMHLEPVSEGPYPVVEAFARAHELAARFDREIVVSIRSISQWRDDWGTLFESDEVK